MMTLNQFDALDFEQKGIVLWEAFFLTDRRHGCHTVALYVFKDFFIEAFYREKDNKIAHFHAFKCAKYLEPYVERLSLADLKRLL